MAITGICLMESHSMSNHSTKAHLDVGRTKISYKVLTDLWQCCGPCGVQFEGKSEPAPSLALKNLFQQRLFRWAVSALISSAALRSEALAWQPLIMEILGVLGHRSGRK